MPHGQPEREPERPEREPEQLEREPEQREEMRKRAEEIRQRAEEARRRAEAARERWRQLTPEQREELRKLRMELGDEMRKQAEALRPTIQQIAENQRTAWREARDVLTAEQKDKLEELRKERMGEQRGRVMRPGAGMGARRARGFRAPGAHALVVERAQHFQAGEHAHDAVVLPARELGVEVAAHEDRREMVLGPRPSREDVADPVHRHRAARLRAPGDEEVPHLLVGVSEREAAKTTAGSVAAASTSASTSAVVTQGTSP